MLDNLILVAIFQVLAAVLLEILVFCGVALCHCHPMTHHNIAEDFLPSITLQNTNWCFKKFVLIFMFKMFWWFYCGLQVYYNSVFLYCPNYSIGDLILRNPQTYCV